MNNRLKIITIFIIFDVLGGIFGAIGGFTFAYLKTSNAAIESGETSKENVLDQVKNWVRGIETELGNIGIVDGMSSHEQMIVSSVEKATPAVVSIIISKNVPIVEQYFVNPFDNLPPEFEDFFEGFGFDFQVPQQKESGTERRDIGGGTGFIVRSDGLIITNRHVVSDEEAEYTVFLDNGDKYEAEILARDPINDLAILKIDKSDLPTLTLGDSNNLKMGQTTIAIGYALAEYRNAVSVGVVSGLSRTITASSGFGSPEEQLENIIQTDAAINFGNSGGPLLNTAGEVIGINVAKSTAGQSIGFALPVNLAKRAISSYEKFGKIISPYLGVYYISLNSKIQQENELPVSSGAWISRGDNGSPIISDSPAERAGLLEGDIILEFGEDKIEEGMTLAGLINKYQVGDNVDIKILRNGEELVLSILLAERPDNL